MGRKRLGAGTRSWLSGRKAASSCVQESAGFLPLGIGAQDRGHAWLETDLHCSAARYSACHRGCYETTPCSLCHYWTKYASAPGTLRIVFRAWEPRRAPSAPLSRLAPPPFLLPGYLGLLLPGGGCSSCPGDNGRARPIVCAQRSAVRGSGDTGGWLRPGGSRRVRGHQGAAHPHTSWITAGLKGRDLGRFQSEERVGSAVSCRVFKNGI